MIMYIFLLWSVFYFLIIFLLYVLRVLCLHIRVSLTCESRALQSQQRGLVSLELELQIAVNCLLGSGSWTQILWQSSVPNHAAIILAAYLLLFLLFGLFWVFQGLSTELWLLWNSQFSWLSLNSEIYVLLSPSF